MVPSPAQNQISLSTEEEITPSNIRIFDQYGNVRYILTNGELLNIDISNLEKGVYFIHAVLDGEVAVSRFLKI